MRYRYNRGISNRQKILQMMMTDRLFRFGLLIMTVTFAQIANAEVYKWVDENGQIHYTNQPPGGQVSSERVEVDECNTDECIAERNIAKEQAQRRLQDTLRQLEEIDEAKRQATEKEAAEVSDSDGKAMPAPDNTPQRVLPPAAAQQGIF